MPSPAFEELIGSVNGINRVFRTSRDYLNGSVVMFVDGLAGVQNIRLGFGRCPFGTAVTFGQGSDHLEGWKEIGSRKIRMNEPPRSGSTMLAYYIPV